MPVPVSFYRSSSYKAAVISLTHIPGNPAVTKALNIARLIAKLQRHGKIQKNLVLFDHRFIIPVIIQMQLFSVIEIIGIGIGNRIQIPTS